MATQAALDKAVTEAASELETKLDKKEETPTKEETPEIQVATEETTETQEEEEEKLSDDEATEARNLYKALKNPKSSSAIIAALAQQAGLFNQVQPPSVKEIKETKREIKDILAEGLGKEYSFLADKLGPAIEKVLDQERKTSEERFAQLRQTEVEREVVTAYEKLAVQTKGESKRLEGRMAELSEQIPIGKLAVKDYMNNLYLIASGEKKTPPAKIADQIKKNASDVGSRLRSGSIQNTEVPSKKMNLNESVNFALDQLTRGAGLKK